MLNMGRKRRRQKSAIAQQQIKILLDVRLALANFDERPVNGLQNNDIHRRNAEQKKGGHQGADDSPDLPDRIHAML